MLESPTIAQNLTKQEEEPYRGTDVVGRLAAGGYLDHVIFGSGVFVMSLFVLTSGTLIYMCAKKNADKPSKMAFEDVKYEEMTQKAKEKHKEIDRIYTNLTKHGIKTINLGSRAHSNAVSPSSRKSLHKRDSRSLNAIQIDSSSMQGAADSPAPRRKSKRSRGE